MQTHQPASLSYIQDSELNGTKWNGIKLKLMHIKMRPDRVRSFDTLNCAVFCLAATTTKSEMAECEQKRNGHRILHKIKYAFFSFFKMKERKKQQQQAEED